jgi:hypothetical protein
LLHRNPLDRASHNIEAGAEPARRILRQILSISEFSHKNSAFRQNFDLIMIIMRLRLTVPGRGNPDGVEWLLIMTGPICGPLEEVTQMSFRWVAACAVICLGFGAEAQAAGCLSGAAVGGLAGHVAGHHAVLGAAAGCAIGHHEAKKQARATAAQNTAQPSQPKQ